MNKEAEIDKKEEELNLLQEKISQIKFLKTGQVMMKTPSFSNISKEENKLLILI